MRKWNLPNATTLKATKARRSQPLTSSWMDKNSRGKKKMAPFITFRLKFRKNLSNAIIAENQDISKEIVTNRNLTENPIAEIPIKNQKHAFDVENLDIERNFFGFNFSESRISREILQLSPR